jgi:hypothetical protein
VEYELCDYTYSIQWRSRIHFVRAKTPRQWNSDYFWGRVIQPPILELSNFDLRSMNSAPDYVNSENAAQTLMQVLMFALFSNAVLGA